MKFDVRIGTLTRQIEIQRTGPNQFAVVPDDGAQIDAVEVAPNTYSILVNGRAFEAIVIPAARRSSGPLCRPRIPCHRFRSSRVAGRPWGAIRRGRQAAGYRTDARKGGTHSRERG